MYYFSTDVFKDMAESINVMSIIVGRKACVENTLHAAREKYAVRGEFLINDDKDEAYSYYSSQCSLLEKNYHLSLLQASSSYL
jgi:hypothetical protein